MLSQFAIKDFASISSLFVTLELLILFPSNPAFACCQVFTRKLEEVGRVLFLISLTQKIPTAHKQSHVSMLQEDLLRLPSFPRSAIDAEFSLFSDPQGIETKNISSLGLLMPLFCPWQEGISVSRQFYKPVVLSLDYASESPGGLDKTQVSGPRLLAPSF